MGAIGCGVRGRRGGGWPVRPLRSGETRGSKKYSYGVGQDKSVLDFTLALARPRRFCQGHFFLDKTWRVCLAQQREFRRHPHFHNPENVLRIFPASKPNYFCPSHCFCEMAGNQHFLLTLRVPSGNPVFRVHFILLQVNH